MKRFLTIFFLLSCLKSNCQTSYIDSLMSGQKPLTSSIDCELWMHYLDTAKIDNTTKKQLILKRLSLDTAKKNIYFEGLGIDWGMERNKRDSLNNLYPSYSPPIFLVEGVNIFAEESYKLLIYFLENSRIENINIVRKDETLRIFGNKGKGGGVVIITKPISRKKKRAYKLLELDISLKANKNYREIKRSELTTFIDSIRYHIFSDTGKYCTIFSQNPRFPPYSKQLNNFQFCVDYNNVYEDIGFNGKCTAEFVNFFFTDKIKGAGIVSSQSHEGDCFFDNTTIYLFTKGKRINYNIEGMKSKKMGQVNYYRSKSIYD